MVIKRTTRRERELELSRGGVKKTSLVIISTVIVVAAVLFLVSSCNSQRPVINSLEAEADWTTPMGSLLVTCNASSPNGDDLIYEWSTTGGTITGTGPEVTWTAPDSADSYNVRVTVTDGHGGQVTKEVTITVAANRVPYINSLVADPDWTTPSASLQVTCNATDPDGDELSYEWSASGGSITGTGAAVNWIAPEEIGMYDITVVVDDGRGGNATRTIGLRALNGTPPVIEGLNVTAKEPKYLKETTTGYKVGKTKEYYIECIASSTNGELVYEWSCDGGAISGEGSLITWTAPDAEGDVTVTVVVTDVADNTVSKSVILNVVPCSACIFG
jgi:predicted secreted protein